MIQMPPANPLVDAMAAARLQGHDWNDINSFVADRMDVSKRGAGYTQDEVHDFLGVGSPSQLNERLTGAIRGNIANPPGSEDTDGR
jgi:hypothetical protein